MSLISLLILATLVSLPSQEGPIVLLDENLSYSRIRSERALAEEHIGGDVTSDGVGNRYAIEFDRRGGHLHPDSVIMRYPRSGGEKLFAVLNVPPDLEAWFEAIWCDHSGNMIVVVVSEGKGLFHNVQRRDYYLVEGMPKPQFGRHLALALGLAVLFVMLFAFFKVLFALRLGTSPFARM